jgi:hypothetical protein
MFGESCMTDDEPESGDWYISCDYGTLNPFSAGLWRVNDSQAVRVNEYYYNGRGEHAQKTDEEYYTELERLAGEREIESVIVDPSAASFIETIRRHGRFAVRKAKNDVENGIITTGRYLRNGKVKIHRRCKDAIREFGLYRWDEKAAEDKPIKENDHCLTGDTLVDTVDGPVRIDELVGKSGAVYCTDGTGKNVGNFHDARMTKRDAQIYEVTLADGRTVKATAEHPFLTKRGWVMLKDLKETDEIACIGV